MNIIERIKKEIQVRKEMYGDYAMTMDEILEFIDQLERGIIK